MLTDSVNDTTITNEGDTILKLLEADHPAAQIPVQLAQLQTDRLDDDMTMTCGEAFKYTQEKLKLSLDKFGQTGLVGIAGTAKSNRLTSLDADRFAEMVVDAVKPVGINS
ncbi:hypothetical protein PHET_02002 [Paragonimus heterotremus]|uniref:T-complex protein 1 subunit alpha n=1 Tax=Paragonimus heterotremus TaxID=100268 RepID=A0A8J4TGP7_9TREM|nr:hypothetical protein PHET_02002 [Paragonimus heterotremus]